MVNYSLMYRLRITPWERYRTAAAASIGWLLDREESDRARPPGRALDLGCGRGQYSRELARRGWMTTGIDYVASAITAARSQEDGSVHFVLGDVLDLAATDLGPFDFFLDIGCFQGFDEPDRLLAGRAVTAVANPGATLLILAFGPRLRFIVDGVSQTEIVDAFPGWELLSVDRADTEGLGWPMNITSPHWYRLRRHGRPAVVPADSALRD